MKLQEILVFGALIIVVGSLFAWSGSSDEMEPFDGKNIKYKSGDQFTLTLNAFETKDTETLNNQANSPKFPYAESWEDFGLDGKADTKDEGEGNNICDNGEPFTDVDLNGEWTPELLEFKWEKVTSNYGGKEERKRLATSTEEPWLLEYVGSDQGKLTIQLTVIDHRSTNRNAEKVNFYSDENKSVQDEYEWEFNCTRVPEDAPIIIAAEPTVEQKFMP